MGTLVPTYSPATVSSGSDHRAFPDLAWLDNPTATTHVIGERCITVYRHGDTHLTNGKIVGRIGTVTDTNPWAFSWGSEFDIEDVANDLRCEDGVSVLNIGGTYKVVIAAREYNGAVNLSPHVLISDVAAGALTTTSTWTRYNVGLSGHTQDATQGHVHKLANGTYLLGGVYLSGGVWSCVVMKVTDPTDWSAPTTVVVAAAFTEISVIEISAGNLVAWLRNLANTEIHKASSVNSGTTWGATSLAFAGYGYPMVRLLASGNYLTVYRSASGTPDTAWRYSTDGTTWTSEVILDATSSTSSYATLLQLDPYHVLCVYGTESGEVDPVDSDLWSQVFTDTLAADVSVDTDSSWAALHEDDWGTATAPTGWNDRGYDDSAWDTASVEGSPPANWADIPNADYIMHADAEDATVDEEYLLRQTFTLTGRVQTAILVHNADNWATVYVNGTEIDVLSGASQYARTFAVELDPDSLRLGENVIAALVTNEGGVGANPTMWQAMLGLYYYDAEPGVWIDWDQDGFSSGAADADAPLARGLPEGDGATDNITADVVSFDWTRGATADHVGQPPSGTCTLVVKNGDTAAEPGKYTPEKTTSSLYGKLRPGLPVWIGRNADGTLSGTGQTVHGVWAGYVRQIVPLPEAGANDTPTAQIICEDPLGYYSRQPTKVAAAEGRSILDLREAVLDDIGEPVYRRDLAWEMDTMPLSAADSSSALRVLEELNSATASRHSIEPADSKDGWYTYRTVDRHWKLGSATDFTLNADNIQATAGYRVTEENVVNYQQVDVTPAHFPAGVSTVWTHSDATFPLTSKRTIWAQFDDFVTDAVLDYTSTGGAVTTTFTNFGTTAKIELWSASSSVVSDLTIEGRMIVRDAQEAVTAEDAASQSTYGMRAGQTVSSAYVGSVALGQGIANFLVWKFGSQHPRMSVDVTNLLATVNGKTLYDTLGLTFDRLYLAGKRFEIIGESGFCDLAASASLIHWGVTWELQETPNQSALGLFRFNESAFGGTDVMAR